VRACGKIGHADRRDAQSQRLYAGRKHSGLNVYRCDRCGLWHVGRKPQRVGFQREQVVER